jgi:hypothetical protein
VCLKKKKKKVRALVAMAKYSETNTTHTPRQRVRYLKADTKRLSRYNVDHTSVRLLYPLHNLFCNFKISRDRFRNTLYLTSTRFFLPQTSSTHLAISRHNRLATSTDPTYITAYLHQPRKPLYSALLHPAYSPWSFPLMR